MNYKYARSSTAPTRTKLTPSGTLPGPRSFRNAFYDAANNRMIALGGEISFIIALCRPGGDTRHHLAVPASQLSALAGIGELAFREPIVITRDRFIIDGYARVELARIQDRLRLPCSEYQLTEEEALR